MPELPEVESLAAFLRGHATGHAVARADAASFSVLKTFDPPLTDLSGQVITEVSRHGKFLDLATDQGLHLIMHLARAGGRSSRDAPRRAKPAGPRRVPEPGPALVGGGGLVGPATGRARGRTPATQTATMR